MPRRHVHVMEWLFQSNQQRGLHMKSIASSHQWKMYISTFFTNVHPQVRNVSRACQKEKVNNGFYNTIISRFVPMCYKWYCFIRNIYTDTFTHLTGAISLEFHKHTQRQRRYVPKQAGRTACVPRAGRFSADALRARCSSTFSPICIVNTKCSVEVILISKKTHILSIPQTQDRGKVNNVIRIKQTL